MSGDTIDTFVAQVYSALFGDVTGPPGIETRISDLHACVAGMVRQTGVPYNSQRSTYYQKVLPAFQNQFGSGGVLIEALQTFEVFLGRRCQAPA